MTIEPFDMLVYWVFALCNSGMALYWMLGRKDININKVLIASVFTLSSALGFVALCVMHVLHNLGYIRKLRELYDEEDE